MTTIISATGILASLTWTRHRVILNRLDLNGVQEHAHQQNRCVHYFFPQLALILQRSARSRALHNSRQNNLTLTRRRHIIFHIPIIGTLKLFFLYRQLPVILLTEPCDFILNIPQVNKLICLPTKVISGDLQRRNHRNPFPQSLQNLNQRKIVAVPRK